MERILSLLPSTTEIAAALGLVDQLVGRSHECTLPREVARLPIVTEPKLDLQAPSRALDARVRELVRDGLSVYRLDAELLRALEPDVILTQTQCDVCAVTPRDLEDAACEWIGASPRLVVVEPSSLADVLDDLVRVAEGCGVGARGRRLREERWEHIESITARATGAPEPPRVACLEWIDPLMGCGSWIPELVLRAGGRPVLGRAEDDARGTSLAELAAVDPDVIVVQPCGFDLARTRRELAPLVGAEGWPRLRAVREQRVALVDGFLHMNRPGPRIGESLEILAEILHPARFDFGWRGRGGWAPLAT